MSTTRVAVPTNAMEHFNHYFLTKCVVGFQKAPKCDILVFSPFRPVLSKKGCLGEYGDRI